MKTGKSLTDLAREIERRANAKKDFVVATDSMMMETTRPDASGTLPTPFLRFGDHDLPLNSIAHGQVGDFAGIPKKYYDRMLAEQPDLLAKNVNTWLHTAKKTDGSPEARMVRTMDGRARAFLSDRFRPLENEELATAVLPVLRDLDLEVMSAEITERRLYIKAVDPRVRNELKAVGGAFGDGQHKIVRCLSPAITISNSEVGMGALSILGGVYDGFCSNLATFGERSRRMYHVGGKHDLGNEETFALLSNEARKKTNEAIWLQVRDLTKAAFERAKFDELCNKITETATHKITGNPVKVIELAQKKFSFSEGEGAAVMRHLIEGGDLSRFGLYNAVTRASQDVEDYDRATELEQIGGVIIELPKTEWHQLAVAA